MGAERQQTAPRRRTPRWAVPLGVLVVVLLAMVVGGRLPDAPTEGRYRPELPPSVFGTACDPLPDGVELDLPVVLRRDRTLETAGGPVRRLDLHYDLVDETDAELAVTAALEEAGFVPTGAPVEGDPDVEQWFDRADYGRVGVGVAAFDVDADSVVRGAIALDLPTTSLDAATRAACTNDVQTKRFPPGLGNKVTKRD